MGRKTKNARNKAGRENTPTCKRCGTCCRKGGPALHHKDVKILASGAIGPQHLFTMRAGEIHYDNVKDRYLPLKGEVVKVRSAAGSTACIFFNQDPPGCGIYARRPVECEALFCRDTRAIEAIYNKDRLCRLDLFRPEDPVRKIVLAHEERCSHALVAQMVEKLEKSGGGNPKELVDLVAYDHLMRPALCQKAGLDPAHMEFLFGRPLSLTVQAFGLAVEKRGGHFVLVPLDKEESGG